MTIACRLAVLYTGQPRTMKDVLPRVAPLLLKDPRVEVHVFAVLDTTPSVELEQWMETTWGESHLQSIEYLPIMDSEFVEWRETQLAKMSISNSVAHYLRHSGSMLEYRQLLKAYDAMERMETTRNGVVYDRILRLRTDVMITKPLGLWYDFSEPPSPNTLLPDIMMNLVDSSRHSYASQDNRIQWSEKDIDQVVYQETNSDVIWKYIHHGYFLITFRKNVLYLGNRWSFPAAIMVGEKYGEFVHTDNPYWWNAESQLEMACHAHGVTIFDSTTIIEDKSLYEYDTERYYQDDGTCHPNIGTFFIQRY